MPLTSGAQRAPAWRGQGIRSSAVARLTTLGLAALIALIGVQGAIPPAAVRAAGDRPKAVIIAGPAATSTSHFLDDARIMADQAEAAGMDVRRVFHPHATWERVLSVIQGANLVVYMGHGNGWPSPYAPFQERTKDGMGLDGYDGASKYSVTYYGATPIRQNIQLAKNAVVALVHLCYASGNGEPGMAIPSWSVARQRVDNYASGFLGAGARTVFSFGWMQKWNLPKALMETNSTMDELFRTDARSNYPYGWIGWDDRYFDSERTPGARLHLDPHPSEGFYRSVTGDLRMTAREWRGEAGAGDGGGDAGDSDGTTTSAPSITDLSVVSTDGGTASALSTTTVAGATLPTFHPNGDGLHDEVVVSHTLSANGYLDVRVTNSSGNVVRKFSLYAAKGASTSRWGGKNDSRNYVADGVYTLTYRPRSTTGQLGQARSVKVLVLTALALPPPGPAQLYARDLDALAQHSTLTARLNKPATVSASVTTRSGTTVRTLQSATALSAGTHTFSWNGRTGTGSFAATGPYWMVVTARTGLGTYTERREVWVGAFKLDASKLVADRGTKVTFTAFSSEPLSGTPKLDLKQPGLTSYTVETVRIAPLTFRVTVTIKSGGSAGTMAITVRGVDSAGQSQQFNTSITIR